MAADYYFGPWPGMPGLGGKEGTLFADKPIVVHLEITETESAKSATARTMVKGFDNIRQAQKFVEQHHDPDKAPAKSEMYAFRNAAWERIDVVAD
jgi:hypothetical protein